MATKNLGLLAPVTLCLVLLMLRLPAQSKEDRALVIIYGTARCKSDPSRILSNAALQVTTNGTKLATGKTTSTGRFSVMANVTTKDQLIALVSKEVVITAPPQACGMPTDAAMHQKVVAPAGLNTYGISTDEIPADYVSIVVVEGAQTVLGLLNQLESFDLVAYNFMNMINVLLGIPPA